MNHGKGITSILLAPRRHIKYAKAACISVFFLTATKTLRDHICRIIPVQYAAYRRRSLAFIFIVSSVTGRKFKTHPHIPSGQFNSQNTFWYQSLANRWLWYDRNPSHTTKHASFQTIIKASTTSFLFSYIVVYAFKLQYYSYSTVIQDASTSKAKTARILRRN
jgi:hypothetical protein